MELKDKTDKQCSAVEVFSLSIKVFVDTFMNYMKNIGTKLRDDDILWIFIVPATWTDNARQLMKESAENVRFNNTYLHPTTCRMLTLLFSQSCFRISNIHADSLYRKL